MIDLSEILPLINSQFIPQTNCEFNLNIFLVYSKFVPSSYQPLPTVYVPGYHVKPSSCTFSVLYPLPVDVHNLCFSCTACPPYPGRNSLCGVQISNIPYLSFH